MTKEILPGIVEREIFFPETRLPQAPEVKVGDGRWLVGGKMGGDGFGDFPVPAYEILRGQCMRHLENMNDSILKTGKVDLETYNKLKTALLEFAWASGDKTMVEKILDR